MADIEFFFDPLCPWAWITSRFVVEVAEQRDLEVEWRFISLAILNAPKFAADDEAVANGGTAELPPQYREISAMGTRLLRVAAAVRDEYDNAAVARFYTAAGDILHTHGRSAALWTGEDPGDVVTEAIADADLPAELIAASEDPRWDEVLQAETALALSRTGDDVGTPIITFDTSRPEEASLFGPVINRIPRGDEALELWDALLVIARTPGIAELKRSLRGAPVFT